MLKSFIKYVFLTNYYYYYYYYCCCCCRDKDGAVDPDVIGVIVLSRVVIDPHKHNANLNRSENFVSQMLCIRISVVVRFQDGIRIDM
jgi:hypothetical protein